MENKSMKANFYYIAYSFVECENSANQIQTKNTFENILKLDKNVRGIFLGNKGNMRNPFWKIRKENNKYFIDRFDFVSSYVEKYFRLGIIRKNVFPYLFAEKCQSIIQKDRFSKIIYMRLTSPEEAICYIRNLNRLNITRIYFEVHHLAYDISSYYQWSFENAYCKLAYKYFFDLVRKNSDRVRIISLTGGLADIINFRFNIEKIDIIPSAHDFYVSQPKEMNFNREKIEIIYVGLNFHYREVETLIEAMNYLSDKFYLRMVGGKVHERDNLRKKYNFLIEQKRLLLEEPVPHFKIREKLFNGDIAIITLPSKGISFGASPLRLFEYMSVGLSIIASDAPCLREILTKESALFFKPGNSQDLANKIEYIAKNEEEAKRIGERAFRDSKKYTYSERAKRIYELLSR